MLHEFLAELAFGVLEFTTNLRPKKTTRRLIKLLVIFLVGVGLFWLWYAFKDL